MPQEANGQVALVTGGSRGIGRAIVEALLGEGWTVYLCSRSPQSVETALTQLQATSKGNVRGRSADVRSQDEVDQFVAWVASDAGRIDCLVNNAGIGVFGAVDELNGEDWRRVLETNLNSAFYATRAVAPIMKKQGSGWIFNIASLAGKNPFQRGAAYNASKFGMVGFSEASMLDLRPYGIRVVAIMPGSVRTDFSHPTGGKADDAWKLAPDDIARTVMDIMRYPDRALPSKVELRPSRPPQKK